MNLLIVSATEMEVAIFRQRMAHNHLANVAITTLVTGVGGIATAYAVTKALQGHKYVFVLQAGVGGSFDEHIDLGEVVFINSDRYGDLGAEDHDKYLDIFDMGLLAADVHPHTGGHLVTPHHPLHDKMGLRGVTGLSINTVSGNERTIARRRELFHCQAESMEGAAFHYVCLQEQVPFAQVRAISNYVIPRDKSQWRMKDAVINLNNWLIDFVSKL